MVKNKFFKKAISGITALSLLLPNFANLAVSAEEPEKFQYTMFGRNGITMSVSSNLCMNGNLHTNKDATITAINKNINGKVTTSADIEKRVKHVYADQKIYDTYFTTNCEVHEEEYVYSDMNIHINNPLFCYSNITLDGNVSLNSSLGTLMNINVTGEVKNANNSVVYSKYGNITIENDSTANVNGLIYAPLGTVTINSPNVTINGIIIADQVVINGSSVNINCNDNIARFIGETSEEYIFSGLEYLPEEWLGDTDEDALFDIYEKVIDSDPFNPDTDTDGLPDGYEVLTLGTDPLEIDTDENGILDCDEDFDTDNLNNLGEYQYQTLPFTSDTDEDGLLDGDEVNYYGTIPTDADTDDDKLLDGEEGYNGCIYIEHGVYFDPLNPDTDGNGILDGDEVFGQTKVEEVETYDEAITEVTVDMDTNGNIDRNLTIESMYNIDAMSTNVHALIGEPFNFETESDFESATITFKIDQSKLGDTQFDNLMILWYNEEEQIFEEMPTTHDIVNSTVSTTTTHFSQYMVVDSEKWYDNWEISFDQLRKMWTGNTSYYKPMNTILLLDCSHQMGNIDPINYRQIVIGYNGVNKDNFYDITSDMDSSDDVDKKYKEYGKRKCYRAEISENIINQMSNDDRAVVMTFSNDVETRTGWSSNWDMLMNGGVSRTSGIQKVNNDGSASFLDNAIQSALSYVEDNAKEAYRIIVITHSDVRCTYNLSSYDYSNVNLNIVNLGSGNISAFLESIVESTGGEVYDAITADELTTQNGEIVVVPPQFVGVDSDGDGIPDLVELYGLKPNGEPINSDPYSEHSDNDGLEDNEELNFSRATMTYELDKSQYDGSVFVWSDPTLMDTDWDSYDDKKENELGSNPLITNFYIDNNDYEFIINSSYYNSEAYRALYTDSTFESTMVWLGNNVFGSNGDKVELYKKAIIDYIDVTLNSKKTTYEIQELIDIERSIYETFNDNANMAYETLKISGISDALTKYNMDIIQDFQLQMQRRLEDMNATYYPDFQNKEAFYKRIDEAKDEYYRLAEQVDSINTKVNLRNMRIEKIDGFMKYVGFTLDVADAVFSSAEVYNDYVTFKSNVSIMEDGIKLLEIFEQSDNIYIKMAASELLSVAKSNYDSAIYAWEEVASSLYNKAEYLIAVKAISKLPKYGSYITFFLIGTGFLSNASEMSLYAEYTVANATIANTLCEEMCEMANTGEQLKNGISISKDYKTAAKRFTDLIVLRKNAEKQYVAFSDSMPWYYGWTDEDNKAHAQNNISKLNEILSRYSYATS